MRNCFAILIVYLSFIASAQDPVLTDGQLIKSIYFGGGSYMVDEYQAAELFHFIDSIPNALAYTVTIHSHTDNIGGALYNAWLSEMRSEAVTQLLLEKGYFPEALEVKDFGMYNPVFDNDTFLGRLKNRRVDVIFWPQVM